MIRQQTITIKVDINNNNYDKKHILLTNEIRFIFQQEMLSLLQQTKQIIDYDTDTNTNTEYSFDTYEI